MYVYFILTQLNDLLRQNHTIGVFDKCTNNYVHNSIQPTNNKHIYIPMPRRASASNTYLTSTSILGFGKTLGNQAQNILCNGDIFIQLVWHPFIKRFYVFQLL